jgi:homoserine O-acetyltransferase
MKFPFYNGRDMVKTQYRLITETLGIPHLLAVTGISSGADHSVQFAVSYPDFMDGIFPVVGGTPFTTQGSLISSWMASIIESCEGWNDGNYEKNPTRCGSNALTVLMPYLYTGDWWEYNVDSPEAYTRWRDAWGAYYLDVQDARDLYYRAKAAGRGWLGDTPGFNGDLRAVLGSIKAKTVFILNPRDQVFPRQYVDTYIQGIKDARVEWIDSPAGHLICCNADPNATGRMNEAIRAFLRELALQGKSSERRN